MPSPELALWGWYAARSRSPRRTESGPGAAIGPAPHELRVAVGNRHRSPGRFEMTLAADGIATMKWTHGTLETERRTTVHPDQATALLDCACEALENPKARAPLNVLPGEPVYAVELLAGTRSSVAAWIPHSMVRRMPCLVRVMVALDEIASSSVPRRMGPAASATPGTTRRFSPR